MTTPTIMAIPAQVKEAETTAKALAPLLGMTEEKVLATIKKRELIVRLQPGGRKITMEKAQRIRDLKLPGIVVAEDNKRFYPYDDLAAHILGFTGIDNQGLTGVEKKYDDKLNGLNGSVSYLSDAAGRLMPGSSEKYVEPKDGLNLKLTIDKSIQSIMERELDQAMVKFQANSALAIAMNPKTGEILGMSSRPGYEPADYQQYPAEIYNRNLPIWMTYEPGSTFKIITLAAALEEKKVNLQQDQFFDPGYVEVGEPVYVAGKRVATEVRPSYKLWRTHVTRALWLWGRGWAKNRSSPILKTLVSAPRQGSTSAEKPVEFCSNCPEWDLSSLQRRLLVKVYP